MDYMILAYGMIAIFAVMSGILLFMKWKNGTLSPQQVIDQYLEVIIECTEKLISLMKLDRDKFESDEEFKTTIIALVIRDIKKLLTEAGVPSKLIDLIEETPEFNTLLVGIVDDLYEKYFPKPEALNIDEPTAEPADSETSEKFTIPNSAFDISQHD